MQTSLSSRSARDAGVAELVDAPDLGSGDQNRGGSSPSARTIAAASRGDPFKGGDEGDRRASAAAS